MEWAIDDLLQGDFELPLSPPPLELQDNHVHPEFQPEQPQQQPVFLSNPAGNSFSNNFNDHTDYIDELDKLLSREEESNAGVNEDQLIAPPPSPQSIRTPDPTDIDISSYSPLPPLLLSPPPAYRDESETEAETQPPPCKISKPNLDQPVSSGVSQQPFVFSSIVSTSGTTTITKNPFSLQALSAGTSSAGLRPQPFQLRNNLLILPQKPRVPPELKLSDLTLDSLTDQAKSLHAQRKVILPPANNPEPKQLPRGLDSAAIAAQLRNLKPCTPPFLPALPTPPLPPPQPTSATFCSTTKDQQPSSGLTITHHRHGITTTLSSPATSQSVISLISKLQPAAVPSAAAGGELTVTQVRPQSAFAPPAARVPPKPPSHFETDSGVESIDSLSPKDISPISSPSTAEPKLAQEQSVLTALLSTAPQPTKSSKLLSSLLNSQSTSSLSSVINPTNINATITQQHATVQSSRSISIVAINPNDLTISKEQSQVFDIKEVMDVKIEDPNATVLSDFMIPPTAGGEIEPLLRSTLEDIDHTPFTSSSTMKSALEEGKFAVGRVFFVALEIVVSTLTQVNFKVIITSNGDFIIF